MQVPSFLQKLYNSLVAWFKERYIRKIFGIALLAAGLFAIISRFDKSGVTGIIAIGCMLVGIGASAYDTLISLREFKALVEDLKQQNALRLVVFSAEEKEYIKRRKRGFRGTFLLKIILIALCCFLLFNNLI